MAAEVEKVYINAQDFLRDAWRLARLVLDSGWRPDWLIALWRGGTPAGAAVHEFLKCHGVKLRHAAVKCFSYTGIAQSESTVKFEFAEEVFAAIRPGERVLVVDDVFDTGRSAAAVRERLDALGAEMRLGCVYYKPGNNVTSGSPDWYAAIRDQWIVFPHEIDGLTREEVAKKDPVLANLF